MSDDRTPRVIIPAFEPPEDFPQLVRELTARQIAVLVVNDGSPAAYNAIFNEIQKLDKCTVLHHPVNRGKGRALKSAFAYLLERCRQCIGGVSADCDGQHQLTDIIACVKLLQQNPEHLVLGCRDFSLRNIPWRNKFGNKITRMLFEIFLKQKFSDTQSGLRGIPLDFMKILLEKPGEGFEFETLMLKECGNKSNPQIFPVLELKIQTIYQKQYSSHFKSIADSLKILQALFSKGL